MDLTYKLISLAKEIESEDPIDWGMVRLDEDQTYELMANNVLEMYLGADKESRDIVMLATVVKLTVENFVLNLKLLQKIN